MSYTRSIFPKIKNRLEAPRHFIQVLAGPRQVGKTTIALELTRQLPHLSLYYTTEDAASYSTDWIDQVYESLRMRMQLENISTAVLIIDEIQKIPNWSDNIKKHWDRDSRENRDIRLVLMGSSRLLIMDGLSESLMGRYELTYVGHWQLHEMKDAFGFSTEQYLWFGGYPGAAPLIDDEMRFKAYIKNSIIEPTLTWDILMTSKIEKPALLRQVLEIGLSYSTQIVSFTKILGQLQEAGNTTTIARYLRLLDEAGLLGGLNKYSGSLIRTKSSIPRFQAHNNALVSSATNIDFYNAMLNPAYWGNVVENSVGGYLVQQANEHPNIDLFYWRDGNEEIDFVVSVAGKIIGIEVKSGDEFISSKSREKFLRMFPDAKLLLIGKNGIPFETFMNATLMDVMDAF